MHDDPILNRTAYTMKLIKHLKRWLKFDGCLKVVTSKYFGMACYGSPVLDDTGAHKYPLEKTVKSALQGHEGRNRRLEINTSPSSD